MRPLKLTMQAFGSYGNRTVVDFTAPRQNLFLVTGDTGSGKTTIFDAIVFALYGEASSSSNRKDGVELQSQFAAPDCEPYVELRFSEIQGGAAAEYTVRRTPRHIRAKKRGAGEIAVSESVSLILPDGSEYPPKETDQKIEEIVGLSKGQFMQVAMIAQGEFMELLRAKSDDKKLIFRRLFGTELYQKIVDELARRMREKRAEIDRIRMSCQAEAARIDVPEDWPRAAEMRALQARIAGASQLSVSDMEALLAELQALVEALEARRGAAQEACAAAEAARDAELKALSDAQNLLKFFDQEKAALETLSACAARAEETEACRRLIARIQSALEIQAEYRYCRDADENLRNRQEQLAALKRRMPELSAALEAAQARAQAARAAQEEALQACARTRERVERALRALKELREIEETAASQARLAAQADARVADVEARLQDVQARAQEHRRQIEALGDAGAELPRWEVRAREAENLFEDAKALQALAEEGARQRRDADAAQLDYAEKSRAFEEKNRAYEAMRRAFLDAQAGLIAREQLRAGAPCPVCGSLEHPNPCRLDAAHDDLTREALDAAGEAASACRTAQERAAAACRSAKDLLREREARLTEALEKLRGEARKHIPDAPKDASADALASAISAWRKAVSETLEGLRRDAERAEELRRALETAQEQREALHAEMEAASKDASAARIEAEKSASQAERMRSAAEFDSERAARDALAAAEQARDAAKNACDAADQLASKVQREQNHARALAEQLEREMPEQARACETRRAAYEKIMAERRLSEADWMALAERYDGGAKEALQRRVDAFDREKAAAEGARESARNAIGGRRGRIWTRWRRGCRRRNGRGATRRRSWIGWACA